MNDSLPKPNTPANIGDNANAGVNPSATQPLQKGVSQQVKPVEKTAPAIPRTPAIPTTPIIPVVESTPIPLTPKPTPTPLNKPPVGVASATPLISPKPKGGDLKKGKLKDTKPQEAKPKKNIKKILMMVLAGVLAVVAAVFIFRLFTGGSKESDPSPEDIANQARQTPIKQTTIVYWGLWNPSTALTEVFSEFEALNPGIKIDYRVQSHKDYRERLQTAIASGNGPDIFRYHASWVSMLAADLAVMPSSVMSAAEFKSSFYPVASEQLQIDGKIVGLPLMYDAIGLYYNKEVLATAGVEPPTTWAELKQLANELTVPAEKKERDGGLQRGGLAIGNSSNVEHYSDILALLILQNGGDPLNPSTTEVEDALTFYTNFISQDKVWDGSLPSSTTAFARGEAAMMIAPSWRAFDVINLNPELDFAIAPLPQLSEEKLSWSNYWAEGVNERNNDKNLSWLVLKYLSSPEVMKKLYSAQAQTRAFGEPYSRVDLADELANDPYVASILEDANYGTSSYMNSFTHDNGINDQINEYYATAINAFLQGDDHEKTLNVLNNGVQQVLSQY